MSGLGFALLTVLAGATLSMGQSHSSNALPVVDLGYGVYRASLYNNTGDFYKFSNIRYAQPPVGELRFREPVLPTGRNATVNDGSIDRICPQASPAYFSISSTFVHDYLNGIPFTAPNPTPSSASPSFKLPQQDPQTNEDCLFLDISTPKSVFSRASKKRNGAGGAPVLVWIHGGGHVSGSKQTTTAGLIQASRTSDNDGILMVSINYRLGAFGWLSGHAFQVDGVANAGLYDQRLALQWVQSNIHKFGGDPKRVTVMGESAGGGSLVHQITAFGGQKGPAPFQQAIVQSPGIQIVANNDQQEAIYQKFLSLLNVNSTADARKLSYDALQKASAAQVSASLYGQFTFGPVVDGVFAPSIPGKMLSQGSFDKSLKLMLGHNADEGLDFTSPYVQNDDQFNDLVKAWFPSIGSSASAYLEKTLYPTKMPGKFGTTGYLDQTGRVALFVGENAFTCNTYFLNSAFGNQTFAYQYSIPPALHAKDVPYTFYNGPSADVVNDTLAVGFQQYLTSFVVNGTPKSALLPTFPNYGSDNQILDLNASSVTQMTDPVANARCQWWEQGLYL